MTCPFNRNKKNTRVVAIWDYLSERGDATAVDMAVEMGVSQHTVTQSIAAARKSTPGVFRISGWHRYTFEITGASGGGNMAPIWSVSPGEDKYTPQSIRPKQSAKACYLRKKAVTLVKRRATHGKPVDTFEWLVRNQLGK